MKATAAQAILTGPGGITGKRAEAIATALRSGGLLPKTGRGLYAADASVSEVALYTLTASSAERVADALSVADTMAALVDQNGNRLLDVVAAAIEDKGKAAAIRHVHTVPALGMAEATYCDGGGVTCYFAPEMWIIRSFDPEAVSHPYVGPIGHIGGAVLMALADAETAHRGH